MSTINRESRNRQDGAGFQCFERILTYPIQFKFVPKYHKIQWNEIQKWP